MTRLQRDYRYESGQILFKENLKFQCDVDLNLGDGQMDAVLHPFQQYFSHIRAMGEQ